VNVELKALIWVTSCGEGMCVELQTEIRVTPYGIGM
jgi:hypothetical protein